MKRIKNKLSNQPKGQAMAEFALAIPVFFMLVLGVIELSRFFLVYSSVFTAAREASRYGSANGTITREIDGNDVNFFRYQDCIGIVDAAIRTGSFAGISSDDVTVIYETEPGLPDPAPVCDVTSPYEATMGDRVKVLVQSTYEPIVGIVPEITVSSENGRTIMMAITKQKEPEPFDLCSDHVAFDDPDPQPGDEDNILFVALGNTSTEAAFIIYQIKNVSWDVTADEPKLVEIRWSSEANPIWISDLVEGSLPSLTIPDAGSIDYWKEFNRNIAPSGTEMLEFVFDQEVDQDDINLSFELIMQHANLPTDFCDPVE